MGVDVSVRRGLDVVALDEFGRLVRARARQSLPDLETALGELKPDVVAIDSPPGWARAGRSRPLERELARLGISMYATPQDPGDHPFYRWMRVGFEVFAAAARHGYPLYRGGAKVQGCAVEVFPHASAVTLRGHLPPRGARKSIWRRAVLVEAGVEDSPLGTVDQLDAALAALTGLRCLQGRGCVVGVPGESVLVLPVPRLPSRRYERDPGEAPQRIRVQVDAQSRTAPP
jgi:predicted nuclease with RNAse H fold